MACLLMPRVSHMLSPKYNRGGSYSRGTFFDHDETYGTLVVVAVASGVTLTGR